MSNAPTDQKVKIPIRTTLEISLQDLDDIAVTAIEGGIGYWSKVDPTAKPNNGFTYLGTPVYVPEDEVDGDQQPAVDWAKQAGYGNGEGHIATEFVHNFSISGEDVKYVLVGLIGYETLVLGLQRILTKQVAIRDDLDSQVRTVMTGDIDIDADAADCIVQAGLFGKVVYG